MVEGRFAIVRASESARVKVLTWLFDESLLLFSHLGSESKPRRINLFRMVCYGIVWYGMFMATACRLTRQHGPHRPQEEPWWHLPLKQGGNHQPCALCIQ